MRAYVIVMAVAVAATAASVAPFRAISRRTGALAHPSDRTVHATPTPILGGAALFVGLLAGMAAAWRMDEFAPVFESPSNVFGVIAAASAIWLTGLIDDLRDVSAPAKLAGMVTPDDGTGEQGS